MAIQNLPDIGDKLFLMHKEVTVTKVYSIFQLIKVHYTQEPAEFPVDICALTNTPNHANTISTTLLGRGYDE